MAKKYSTTNMFDPILNSFSVSSLLVLAGLDLAAGSIDYIPPTGYILAIIGFILVVVIDGYVYNAPNGVYNLMWSAILGGVLIGIPSPTVGLIGLVAIGAFQYHNGTLIKPIKRLP
jgi:hypothetical protein